MTPGSKPSLPEEERLLIVEDDPQLRRMVEEEIAEAGFEVRSAADAREARAQLDSWQPHLVLSDLRLPDEDGLALLRHVKSRPLPAAFIIITAFGTIPQAVEALKAGADNFLTKPLDFDHMLISITRALEVRRLRSEVRRFSAILDSSTATAIPGRSPAMQFLYYQIRQIAGSAAPVMILGESGVGKELVAHALHQASDRADRPFVAVNCAGIPESLVESELFGHAPGAFTGARARRRGLFEEADGGVLFLDEVAELPLGMQAKLLRALQSRLIRPVGSNLESRVNVRVIAATNRDLDTEIRQERFRQDLYYRLTTFVLNVPPLRERDGDIELLAARFAGQYGREAGKKVRGFSNEAIEALKRHPFPGNVRELQNIVQYAIAFSQSEAIRLEDLPESVRCQSSAPMPPTSPDSFLREHVTENSLTTLEEMKVRYARFAVQATGGNKRRAAALLGIERQTLYKYLAKGEDETSDA